MISQAVSSEWIFIGHFLIVALVWAHIKLTSLKSKVRSKEEQTCRLPRPFPTTAYHVLVTSGPFVTPIATLQIIQCFLPSSAMQCNATQPIIFGSDSSKYELEGGAP